MLGCRQAKQLFPRQTCRLALLQTLLAPGARGPPASVAAAKLHGRQPQGQLQAPRDWQGTKGPARDEGVTDQGQRQEKHKDGERQQEKERPAAAYEHPCLLP